MSWHQIPGARQERRDGYVNMMNKYGTARDSSAAYEFAHEGIVPDAALTDQYESNGLFAKIIDTPAEEAVKHGFAYGLKSPDVVKYLDDSLERLDWEEKAATAIKWSRLYGGALAVMLIDDGGGIDEPVNWRSVRGISEIRVYERAVVWPDYTSLYGHSPGGPAGGGGKFGTPRYYQVSSMFEQFDVHESRCLAFRNGILPERTMSPAYRFWGMPEYARIKRELAQAVTGHGNAAKMLDRSVQAIYKMKGLAEKLETEDGEDAVMRRLQVIDMARGLLSSISIDAEGEDYDFRSFAFSGVRDVIDSTCNMLSAVTNIPQTILFGRSPAGQNSTGDSDFESYYNFVERIQKLMLRKNLKKLLGVIVRAGVKRGELDEEPEIKLEFNPLWSMSESERADADQKKAQTQQTRAQTAQAYVDMGALDPSEVRRALAAEEEFSVEEMLDDVDEEELWAGMPGAPEDETDDATDSKWHIAESGEFSKYRAAGEDAPEKLKANWELEEKAEDPGVAAPAEKPRENRGNDNGGEALEKLKKAWSFMRLKENWEDDGGEAFDKLEKVWSLMKLAESWGEGGNPKTAPADAGRGDAGDEDIEWVTINGAAVPLTKSGGLGGAVGAKIASESALPKAAKNAPQTISENSSTGKIIRDGDKVYKNTTIVGLDPKPGEEGRPSLEAEVYGELEGNPNVLPGRLVDYDGEPKIETPFVKNIVSTDAIPEGKRESVGRNIIGRNLEGMTSAVNDLSNAGYTYSDRMQFAYHDGSMKMFDFSNATRKGVEEAVERNYSDYASYLRSFGLAGAAERVSRGMELRGLARETTADDLRDGMHLMDKPTEAAVKQLVSSGVEANNVYYSRNPRTVQGSTKVGQTDPDESGNKYIVSAKPLSREEMSDWEMLPIYVQPINGNRGDAGDRDDPDNWITMNGAPVFVEEGQTAEEAGKAFASKKEAERDAGTGVPAKQLSNAPSLRSPYSNLIEAANRCTSVEDVKELSKKVFKSGLSDDEQYEINMASQIAVKRHERSLLSEAELQNLKRKRKAALNKAFSEHFGSSGTEGNRAYYGDNKTDAAEVRGVGVLVVKDGRVLCGRRTYNGQICGPGGHIEDGETPAAAAIRETQEEFGITPTSLELLGQLEGLDAEYGEPYIYVCTEYDGVPRCKSYEMTEPEWLDTKGRVASRIFGAMFPPFRESLKLLQNQDLRDNNRLTSGEKSDRMTVEKKSDGGPGSGRYPKGSGGNVDPETAKRYNEKLVGVKASSGIVITGISNHALWRADTRGISEDAAYDLISNASIDYPGNIPDTVCQQKDNMRVVIDEITGNIVTFVDLDEED